MNTILKDQEAKEKIKQRLRRIEGQVRGVENMLDEDRDCHEIMQQLVAVRSALQSVSRVILQEFAVECLLNVKENDDNRARQEKIIEDLITFLDKAP